jgi:alkylation response protein AidB-like acyl-CoA dehydrogenase
MDNVVAARDHGTQREHLCAIIGRGVPGMEGRAVALDDAGAFPTEDLAWLAECGTLIAPFPMSCGGLGMGTEPAGAIAAARLLRLLGRGNLAVGRLYEGHVNAVRLLRLYGSEALLRRAFADAKRGWLIALWVTDDPANPLTIAAGGVLRGGKAFCSGAGGAPRAVVTVGTEDGATRLAYLPTDRALVTPLAGRMQGMRAAVTARVSFDGVMLAEPDWIGEAGDYLREPHFSAGAWRTSAVTSGGLEALVMLAMQSLVARHHAASPHQQARMGRAWIAQETALLWVNRAATIAEATTTDAKEVVATVNFARIAIEAACLEALTLVERSVGLAAFLHPSPLERVRRDLATYLRQPAPDDVLCEAAAHIIATRGSA